jgi:hypothetical protein
MAAIDKALRHVADICTGKERWTMRIPCQPDTDSDCVIADALMGAKKALQSATAPLPANARAVAEKIDRALATYADGVKHGEQYYLHGLWKAREIVAEVTASLPADAPLPATARSEPVAWFRLENGIRVYYETEAWPDMTPLYAAPLSERGAIRYERRPELDKRIANGDDFAGDAWVRWTAVGHSPNGNSREGGGNG